jgi:ubiquinone/menaquinone biosynthesis C-methylase UbiE
MVLDGLRLGRRHNSRGICRITRDYPLCGRSNRELANRAGLGGSRLVVDLCGAAGATAWAILDLVPMQTQLVWQDHSTAMQRVGRQTLPDPHLTWVTAPAEDLPAHISGPADAIVCNSATRKTNVARHR